MTLLRAGTLYSIPWAAEIRSWQRASAAGGVSLEQLRDDIRRGFAEAHSGHSALAEQVTVGHITVSPGILTSDSLSGEIRMRPAENMATEDRFARQMDASLNFRLAGVPDRDRFSPYTPWFGRATFAREPIVANPPDNYRAADARDPVERAASYATTRASTDANINGTTPIGQDVRSLLPGWVVPVAIVGGALAAIFVGAYAYRAVVG